MKNSLAEEKNILTTRFGDLYYDDVDRLSFPQSLCGFESLRDYVLLRMPGIPHYMRFYLLQSLEAPELSLILKVSDEAHEIKQLVDIQRLAHEIETLEIPVENAELGFVTTVTPENTVQLNIQAPILISRSLRKAWQIILTP